MSGYREWQAVEVNRVSSELFDDYRARAGSDVDGTWRIEDEASHQRRYISVAEGLRDNRYGHYLEKPIRKPIPARGSTKERYRA